MIKAVIVDDEVSALRQLKTLLKRNFDNIDVVAECSDATCAKAEIQKNKPDVVFMDIELNGTTAFELLKEISYKNFKIVFVTAHNEYATQAFEQNAIGYLLKPICHTKLAKTIESIEKALDYTEIEPKIGELFHNHSVNVNKVVIRTTTKDYVLKLDDVIRCEADRNYTYFFMINNNKIVASKNIKEYASLFEKHYFIRPHKSHLVNINHIITIDKTNGCSLILSDNSSVPISFRKKRYVFKILNQSFLHN